MIFVENAPYFFDVKICSSYPLYESRRALIGMGFWETQKWSADSIKLFLFKTFFLHKNLRILTYVSDFTLVKKSPNYEEIPKIDIWKWHNYHFWIWYTYPLLKE